MKALSFVLSIALIFFFPIISHAQGYEYGDAPETAVAYPSTGVVGAFPTCITVGTSYVQHNNFGAQLGPTFDFEGDGNAGLCPGFAPYDNDECFADGDAGLLFPEPFTIVNNAVVTCPNSMGTSLGNPCAVAVWGSNIDIDLSNNMPNQTPGLMNVIIDFNQNGVWGDLVTCPTGQLPEHVLQNFPIPWGFAGPLSALMPPAFTIGPNSGYVWARFSITEQPVAANWDGHGFFEDGESEDYLLYIAPEQISDFGDAPEDVLAYPSTGVVGSFPTCIGVGSLGYVEHFHMGADLGPSVDFEVDGNAGLCPSFAPYDDDECFAGGDAGLTLPEPYTIVGGLVTTCPNSTGTPLGYPCDTAVWGINVDIDVNNFMPSQLDAYMNLLVDWNMNGIWGDTVYCGDVLVEEHVLQNFPVPTGYSGPLSGLAPPDFVIGPDHGFAWCRFTISDYPVYVPWMGDGSFEDGETEDYLLHIDTIPPTGDLEYGDAPDSAIAYPVNGVMGYFPTCMNVVASGYVSHMNFGAHFGPAFDFEPEGNSGLCPLFMPYDNDECFQDGDAGLIIPEPYTIQSGAVVPCPGVNGTSLGNSCAQAVWGTDIDIDVTNNMPNQAIGYFNVLFDWNMNGSWGDIANCPGAVAPEHVVQNYIIPNGFSGPVSGLMVPNFIIGPNGGYVWARFTISEQPVPVNWDGAWSFEDGESEDYLIHVSAPPPPDKDYGDAPEDTLAYPGLGVNGQFPTCVGSGPPNHFVSHGLGEMIFWGPMKDMEPEGNAGNCSPYTMPYNNDECWQDGDAGILFPQPFTIQLSGVVPCPGSNGGILDTICDVVRWGTELDIQLSNLDTIEAIANVLMDFNQNGRWDFDTTMNCNGVTVHEHVLKNFPIPPYYNGPLSALSPPDFLAGPNVGYIWVRFTVSEQDVPLEWDGVGMFDKGESEDYLLYLDLMPGVGEYLPEDKLLDLQIFPNPTRNSCTISYTLIDEADVEISIYDIRGSKLRTIASEKQLSGSHQMVWDGNTAEGYAAGSGIYVVAISLDKLTVAREKVLINK